MHEDDHGASALFCIEPFRKTEPTFSRAETRWPIKAAGSPEQGLSYGLESAFDVGDFLFGEEFGEGAEGVIRYLAEFHQDKSVQRVMEVGIDIEAHEFGSEGDIFPEEDGEPEPAVGQGTHKTVHIVQGLACSQELVRIHAKEIRLEGMRGGQEGGSVFQAAVLLHVMEDEALVEGREVIADAGRSHAVFDAVLACGGS